LPVINRRPPDIGQAAEELVRRHDRLRARQQLESSVARRLEPVGRAEFRRQQPSQPRGVGHDANGLERTQFATSDANQPIAPVLRRRGTGNGPCRRRRQMVERDKPVVCVTSRNRRARTARSAAVGIVTIDSLMGSDGRTLFRRCAHKTLAC
jgi:hypothetical protein